MKMELILVEFYLKTWKSTSTTFMRVLSYEEGAGYTTHVLSLCPSPCHHLCDTQSTGASARTGIRTLTVFTRVSNVNDNKINN